MESSRVDTTLELNINPFRHSNEALKREVAGSDVKVPVKQETGVLVEELNRVSAENKRLTEMLTVLCEHYNSLHSQFMKLVSKNSGNDAATSKKRKVESEDYANMIGFSGNTESICSDEESCKKPIKECMKAKISRVYMRTDPSDESLIMKDGYQWRKYGQKVTRDNPSPRAYFKCSFAPSCPVKKKVQRSAEDPSILVATYEGEHNHAQHCSAQLLLSPNSCANPRAAPTLTLELMQPAGLGDETQKPAQQIDEPAIQQILVQQMAASLTRDPTFTAALAAAISETVVDQNRFEKW